MRIAIAGDLHGAWDHSDHGLLAILKPDGLLVVGDLSDGQQRIATICLLFAAIRDVLFWYNTKEPPISQRQKEYNNETIQDITNALVTSSAVEMFSVEQKGNTQVTWNLSILNDVDAVQYKIIAKADVQITDLPSPPAGQRARAWHPCGKLLLERIPEKLNGSTMINKQPYPNAY